MTDRVNALVVTLETDQRVDDVQGLVDAIKKLRGVADVSTNVADLGSTVAQARATHELGQKLLRVLYGKGVTT